MTHSQGQLLATSCLAGRTLALLLHERLCRITLLAHFGLAAQAGMDSHERTELKAACPPACLGTPGSPANYFTQVNARMGFKSQG